jgi:hypothetical protein
MPQITVRKCRFTGELFVSEQEFAKHLRGLRKEFSFKRQVDKRLRECKSVFTQMRATCRTPADIERFIADHWETFVIHARHKWIWGSKNKNIGKNIPKLTSISITFDWGSFTYGRTNGLISNTHSAPLTGPWAGKTNWGGMQTKNGVPQGYLGWTGKIKFSIERTTKANDVSGSDFFDRTGLFTGSGGGSEKLYEYTLEMFADDWPALLDDHYRSIVKRVIGFKTDEEMA